MRALLVGVVAWGMAAGPAWAAGPSRGVAELEAVLADWRLGCGGCPMRFGWDGHQLALFVGGRLAALGFPVELARSGSEWWVVVRCPTATGEVRLPVLPGLPPLDREGQFTLGVYLGRIPWAGAGEVASRYAAPEELLPLPENCPPTVRLRVHPTQPQAGEEVWFTADVTDPDGVIVQALWEFGDGETSTWWSPEHAYREEGMYTVTLTVVDDRGGVGRATAVVHVVGQAPAPPPGGGCGCGG